MKLLVIIVIRKDIYLEIVNQDLNVESVIEKVIWQKIVEENVIIVKDGVIQKIIVEPSKIIIKVRDKILVDMLKIKKVI
jgi:hypothetical protein